MGWEFKGKNGGFDRGWGGWGEGREDMGSRGEKEVTGGKEL
jgi:hypothetical protein